MKKNSLFLLLLTGCAVLLPAQELKSGTGRVFIGKPDLLVEAAIPNPSTRVVEVIIKNREFATAKIEDAFLAVFWDTQNTTHRIVKRISHSSVNSQAGYATLFTVPVEWSQLGIKVDSGDLIDEKNEDNNLAFIHFKKPDLTVSAQIYDQETRMIRYHVKNAEFSTAPLSGPCDISFWDPKNSSHRSDFALSPAQVNNANGHTGYFPIPGDWAFQVGIKVDPANVIDEANEGNNIAFTELARADLIISAKISSLAPRKIEYTFKNTEYSSAPVTKPVKLVIWDTMNSSKASIQSFSAAMANAPAGYTALFTIPESWSAHIGLKIDREEVIEEMNEENNFAYVHY
ncbi:MAG: hypothetical protein MUC72_08075 [Acidobacteria bacterium]|jgi:hypothetical protein|nr:hypothetical protein [Acidobacteriota bacterium]